ncbi:UPF0721 transmembrane protein, partial [Planctomyces bekefii]
MLIIGYLAMILVGLVLGLIGGGGAILTMPLLVYLCAVPPVLATSYSLFIVGMTSAFGVWRYHQQKLVDYRVALVFVTPSFLGTYLARHVLLPALPHPVFEGANFVLGKDQLVMIVFATVMVAASLSMIRSRAPSTGSDREKGQSVQLVLWGFLVGAVAGFVGAGGGFLIIPALVTLGGIPMTVALPTSLFIIATNSLVAFAGDLWAGTSVDWILLAATTTAAFVGLLMG